MLTLTLPIGVAVSLFLLEITGLSAGGIITPGYVALVLDDPRALALLGMTTLLTWLAVALLSRALFLFGSRRFSLTVLIGVVFSTVVHAFEWGHGPVASEWIGFGFIVPGLIAHQFARQGIASTIAMITIAAPATRAIALLVLEI